MVVGAMSSPRWVHGIWAGATVIAFAAGTQFFPGIGAQEKENPDSERRKEAHSSRVSREGREASDGGADASGVIPGSLSQSRLDGAIQPGAGTLTEQDIARLGKGLKSSSPIERRLAYARLLNGLTKDNALLIRQQVEHLHEHSSEFREFHYAWGALAGEAAVLHGIKTEKEDMAATFAGWASSDSAAALAWYDQTSDNEDIDRNGLKWGAVFGLANADPGAALDFVSELRAKGDKDAKRMVQVITGEVLRGKDPVEAAQWTEEISDENLRVFARDRIAGEFARQDPEAAAEWAAQFNDEESDSRLVNHVSREWAQRNPQSAVEWLESLGSSKGRTEGFGSAFSAWARHDPEAAGNYLREMVRSPERDAALSGYATRIMHEDPASAISWAEAIADASQRENTLVQTARHYFRRDHEAAVEWLANSGLSEEARQKLRRKE